MPSGEQTALQVKTPMYPKVLPRARAMAETRTTKYSWLDQGFGVDQAHLNH